MTKLINLRYNDSLYLPETLLYPQNAYLSKRCSCNELILFADYSLPDGSSSGFPVLLGLFTETLHEGVNVNILRRARTILTRVIMPSGLAPLALIADFGNAETALRKVSSIKSLVKGTPGFCCWTWSAKSRYVCVPKVSRRGNRSFATCSVRASGVWAAR